MSDFVRATYFRGSLIKKTAISSAHCECEHEQSQFTHCLYDEDMLTSVCFFHLGQESTRYTDTGVETSDQQQAAWTTLLWTGGWGHTIPARRWAKSEGVSENKRKRECVRERQEKERGSE